MGNVAAAAWLRSAWAPAAVAATEADCAVEPPPQPKAEDGATEAAAAGEPPLSKRKMKRLAKEEKYRQLKKARKDAAKEARNAEKERKRAEREEAVAHLSQEERERIRQQHIEAIREKRVDERARRDMIRTTIANAESYGVCIDLGWNEAMTDRERNSMARQLSYSYSALRKCVANGQRPVKLSIVGLCGVMRGELDAVATGWQVWPIALSELPLRVADNVVYLTHDSDNVLRTLDPACTYVIGGMVDHNRLKGATAAKARELGVRTARFNLDEVVALRKGTPVLTVNHCVELLIQVANGRSWADAYRSVLPERKGITSTSARVAPDASSESDAVR